MRTRVRSVGADEGDRRTPRRVLGRTASPAPAKIRRSAGGDPCTRGRVSGTQSSRPGSSDPGPEPLPEPESVDFPLSETLIISIVTTTFDTEFPRRFRSNRGGDGVRLAL